MNDFLPFIIIGLATGSVYGLAATGLVLSYKTSGIFNFAFGAIAAMSVFVFYWLHDQNNVPWPVAGLICLFVLGPVMGLLLELLARQLQAVNHAFQIATTVGLLLFIVGIGSIWYQNTSGSFPDFLPTSTVRLFGVNITWEQIIIVIVALVTTGGLYWFLRVARLGRAMRALVDDPNLVSMVGESPVAVRRWAWVISCVFAALAGLLIAPSLPLDATTLTLLVVQAFGAAAIGYFSNLPLAYLGGLFLGIAGALATKYVSSVPWLINLPSGLPFIVLIIVLVALPRSRLTLRRFTVPIAVRPSWQAPPRIRLGVGAMVIGALCAVPSLVGTKLILYAGGLTLVILILSLGLLVRTSRQVSLCQYAFAAIGGAAMSHFTSEFHLPWVVALLLAGMVAVPIGALVAIPAIRLSGVFLALATLGFGILLEQVFYDQNYMFGSTGNGVATSRPVLNIGPFHAASDVGFYFVILVVAVVAAVIVILVTETRLGRVLRAMGDSPVALESSGLSVNVTRVLVFCLSAYIAAISGALLASLYHYGLGSDFPSFSSFTLIAVVMIVVVGDPWYALLAGGALSIVPAYLTSNTVGDYLNVIFGVSAVLVPTYRHLLPTVPEGMRDFLDRIGGRSARVARREESAASPGIPLASAELPHEGGAPALVVTNLSVRYGGTLAVDGVSLAAPLGSITGLIGPNGAGKTTIFNACSGLVRPSGGEIELFGRDVSRLSPSSRARRGLGRTFQRVELFETLDVRTNVALARECSIAGANPYRHMLSSPAESKMIDAAARAAVETTGIAALLDLPVRDLSTGQRRLVELARVLASPVRVVLLDEPSSGLDRQETQHLGEILTRVVSERGLGLLLVEHDMSLVRQVCERVYVLDFGELIFEGSASEMATSEVVKAAYLGADTEPRQPGSLQDVPG